MEVLADIESAASVIGLFRPFATRVSNGVGAVLILISKTALTGI